MSDFNFDLSDEKLSAIEEAISQLEGDISETQQKVKRLEVIEFFDRGDSSRQTVVHWLEEVDPETIVSIGEAKDAFIEYSESRAVTDMKVGHGDVLVIGGDCPYYALCAKVDIGVVGGDAGFQSEDPMDVAGTELENEKAFKEFIVWGGCGNEGGAPGGGDDCAASSAVSVPTLCASASGGGTSNIQVIDNVVPTDDLPVEFPLFKLKQLSLTQDMMEPVVSLGGGEFLAFNTTTATDCGDCGLFVDLKKFATRKNKHDFESTVSLFTLNSQPVNATPKTLQLNQTTLTLTPGAASLNSDPCGQLTVSLGGGGGGGGGGCGASINAVTMAELAPGAPVAINELSITPNGEETVSLGSVNIVSDIHESDISNSAAGNPKVFLPIIDPASCPITQDVTIVESVSVSVEEINTACDGGSGEQCKTIRVTVSPIGGTLSFNCGLLTNVSDMTGGGLETIEEFKVPCGCDPDPECDPNGVQVVTLTFTKVDGGTEAVPMNWNGTQFVATGVGNNAVISCNPATGIWTASGNAGSGSWGINGSANSPTAIPDGQHHDLTTYSFS